MQKQTLSMFQNLLSTSISTTPSIFRWSETNVQQTLSALNSNQTSKTLNSLDQALLQLFSSKPGRSHESTPDDARKLTQQLLNTVQKNLSNIQLSQYKSIDRAHLEQTPIQNHFQVDIPLRLPEGLFNIFFQLREKKISEDEKEQTAKKKPRSRSRWSVYLELEMGNEGTMAVEMNLCEQDIDLQFWAEKPSLREKTLTELQQLKNSLEAQGLHVEDLRCSVKPPPKREMTFNASLIDIQT